MNSVINEIACARQVKECSFDRVKFRLTSSLRRRVAIILGLTFDIEAGVDAAAGCFSVPEFTSYPSTFVVVLSAEEEKRIGLD